MMLRTLMRHSTVALVAFVSVGLAAACGSSSGTAADGSSSVPNSPSAHSSSPSSGASGAQSPSAAAGQSSSSSSSPASSSASAPASSASAASGPITITDARGTVTLPKPAVHIAVQEWQFAEDLIALGIQPTMVADDQGMGQPNPLPPQVKSGIGKYVSLGSRLAPNLEVLASQPLDLIIVDKNEQLKNYDQFAKIAPTMVLDTTSWADFYPNLEKIANAVGESAKGAQIESSIKKQFADAKQKLQQDSSLRTLIAVPNATGFFPFTGNSIQAGVMTDMGLSYAYPVVPGSLTVKVGLEALPPLKPDAIFLAPVPDQPTLITDSWKTNALWKDLPAVKASRVFTEDRSIWSVGRGALSIPLMIQQTLSALGK